MYTMNQNPYKNFENFVLRTPILSLEFYKKLTSKAFISDEEYKKAFENDIVKEAIFLASPILYSQIEKWCNDKIDDKKKADKIKKSFLKYLSRMCSRCTPFGMFAGCSVGNFDEYTSLVLKASQQYNRHTRLDMNYLVALSQRLATHPEIQDNLLFFSNTSIYKTGEDYRYVEYEYNGGHRRHDIVSVDQSIYLDKTIELAKEGITLKELAPLLSSLSTEVTDLEASEFVNELVDSQLLISELEPSVSGEEFLDQILHVLERIQVADEIKTVLRRVKGKLLQIDTKIGNDVNSYREIADDIESLGVDFDIKYLFQTDLILETKKNVLDTSLINDLKKGFAILNKMTLPPIENNLSKFKSVFRERYEEREVLLSNALDVEMGIGYKQDRNIYDINPLLDNLVFPKDASSVIIRDFKLSSIDLLLQRKILDALRDNNNEILLDDKDFDGIEENWSDIPDTISSMIELVTINGQQKIVCSGMGGSSASNLIGRFCHGDTNLMDLTLKIVKQEQEINSDKILAEVVHLPESRVGNILMRPSFRNYEIPYLATSLLPKEQQIDINDLYISMKGRDYLYLRSKRLNKEVIPQLSNAHNYSGNSLPIYQFLCEMQSQNKRAYMGINLGPITGNYEFTPRIVYKNIILSEAFWNFKKSDIVELLDQVHDLKKLQIAMKSFVEKKKLPVYVMLVDGDNELLVNTQNIDSVIMLLDTVKNRSNFKIKECLSINNTLISDVCGEHYSNQIIISFYNSNKLQNN